MMCMERIYGYQLISSLPPPKGGIFELQFITAALSLPLQGVGGPYSFITSTAYFTLSNGISGIIPCPKLNIKPFSSFILSNKRQMRSLITFLSAYKICGSRFPCTAIPAGNRFLISNRSTFQSIDITSGLASAINGANTELPLQKEI